MPMLDHLASVGELFAPMDDMLFPFSREPDMSHRLATIHEKE
jgi:hypothetical protein